MTRVMTILPLVAAFALPAAAQQTEWPTFQGDLKAQKYARSTQITPQNVGQLEKAWELHTGDVSDGSGDIPGTVWSATPILANDMLYVGTPFYRILAVRPDTGKVEWTYDPQTELKALTQPELKNRGVAYWQADEIQVRSPRKCPPIGRPATAAPAPAASGSISARWMRACMPWTPRPAGCARISAMPGSWM